MENMITKLKKNNKRLTKQRLAILNYLQGVTTHPSADRIYKDLKGKIASISLATVYRNLKYLAENNLILQLEATEKKKARFDGNINMHWHFFCTDCHSIYDIWDPPKMSDEVKSYNIAQIKKIDCKLYGICKKCHRP